MRNGGPVPSGDRNSRSARASGSCGAVATGGECGAETKRHRVDPDHRSGTDRHRAGVRVRLLRRAGMQGALGGRFPGGAGELEPCHHHDRPGPRRRDLHRAGALEGGLAHRRERTPRRPAADHGRPDRAQLLAGPRARRRARCVRGRTHRCQPAGDRQGRGSRAVSRRDGPHRARMPARDAGPRPGSGGCGPVRHRLSRNHPPLVHARRKRRRYRVQPRRVRGNLRARGSKRLPPPRC